MTTTLQPVYYRPNLAHLAIEIVHAMRPYEMLEGSAECVAYLSQDASELPSDRRTRDCSELDLENECTVALMTAVMRKLHTGAEEIHTVPNRVAANVVMLTGSQFFWRTYLQGSPDHRDRVFYMHSPFLHDKALIVPSLHQSRTVTAQVEWSCDKATVRARSKVARPRFLITHAPGVQLVQL